MSRLKITKTDGTETNISADIWRADACGFLTFSLESGPIVLSIRPEYVLSIEPVEEQPASAELAA